MNIHRRKAVRAGVVTLLSFILLVGALLIYVNHSRDSEGFHVNLKFNFLNNLSEGAPVLFAGGIKVGRVEKIYQRNLQTFVRIYLEDRLRGRIGAENTVFTIFSNNMLGQKYISLTYHPGRDIGEPISDNAEIFGISPPSVDRMMLTFSKFFQKDDAAEIISDLINQTERLQRNYAIIFQENKEDLNIAMKKSFSLFRRLSERMRNVQQEFNIIGKTYVETGHERREEMKSILENLTLISKNMREISEVFEKQKGSLSRITQNEKLMRESKEVMQYSKDFINCLSEKPWVLIYKEPCD